MSERSQEDQGSEESELVNPWQTVRSTRANGLLTGHASRLIWHLERPGHLAAVSSDKRFRPMTMRQSSSRLLVRPPRFASLVARREREELPPIPGSAETCASALIFRIEPSKVSAGVITSLPSSSLARWLESSHIQHFLAPGRSREDVRFGPGSAHKLDSKRQPVRRQACWNRYSGQARVAPRGIESRIPRCGGGRRGIGRCGRDQHVNASKQR